MNTALRWTALGALFIIPFLPLYVDGSLFFPFISSKGFAFRILVEIAAASWLLLALTNKEYRPKFSWLLLIYGALVGWMFIADLAAVNPDKAFWSNFERMDGWVTLIHAFLFFVVLSSILTVEKKWRAWWLAVLAASALVVVHGFLQLLCAGQECVKSFPIHQGGVRVDANLGNAAYLAAYLLFTIAVSVWQGVVSKGVLRYALLTLAALQVIILFSTATRGAILGFVAAIGLGALLWAFTAGKTGRKVGAGILAGLVVLVGGFISLKDSDFVRNDPTLTRIASISLETAETRFTLWEMAWKGFLERPVTGWGHEGFIFVFTKHYDPSLYAQEPWFDRAHSVYFDWLIYGGAPALLLFLALLLYAAYALLRSDLPRIEKVALVAALGAYAFQALVVFDNLMTYILLAAILAVAHSSSARPIKKIEHVPEVSGATASAVALPLVLVCTVAIIWVVNISNVEAGKTLIRGAIISDKSVGLTYFKEALAYNSLATQEIREQLVTFSIGILRDPQVPTAVKQEALQLAFSEMNAQIAKVPEDARVMLQYAQGLEAAGDFEGALIIMAKAEELAPQKQLLHLQKGMILWRAGRPEEALTSFERAYLLDERNEEAAMYFAAGKVLAKDAKGADEFLLARFGTTTIDHDIMRFAYFDTKRYDDLIKSALLRAANFPTDISARYLVAQAYAASGRLGEAKRVLEQATLDFPAQASNTAALLKQLEQPAQ